MTHLDFLAINSLPTTAGAWAVRIGIIVVIAAVVIAIRLRMTRRK
jgi:hypothetical protein